MARIRLRLRRNRRQFVNLDRARIKDRYTLAGRGDCHISTPVEYRTGRSLQGQFSTRSVKYFNHLTFHVFRAQGRKGIYRLINRNGLPRQPRAVWRHHQHRQDLRRRGRCLPQPVSICRYGNHHAPACQVAGRRQRFLLEMNCSAGEQSDSTLPRILLPPLK